MKKSILSGAIALSLGIVCVPASALEVNIVNMDFGGLYASTGNISETVGSFNSTELFNNNHYYATQVDVFDQSGNWSALGGFPAFPSLDDPNDDSVWIQDFSYDFTLAAGEFAVALSFDWSVNYDIPVIAIVNCGDNTAGSACIASGLPMAAGPFPGNEPTWNGYVAYALTAAFDSTPITSVAENTSGVIYTAAASAGTADIPTYTLSGLDSDLFTISNTPGSEGELSFNSNPDRENALDDGANNVYDVSIIAAFADVNFTFATVYKFTGTLVDAQAAYPVASYPDVTYLDNGDGTIDVTLATEASQTNLTAPSAIQQNLTITVTDVNEFTPSFASVTSISVAENISYTGYTAIATDADASNTITYSIAGSGADDSLFTISNDSGTEGQLSFISAPDFEANGSNAGNNTYVVDITATDSGSPTDSVTQTVTVTVTDVVTETLQITSASSVNYNENGTGVAYTLQAVSPNSISITGPAGADAASFTYNASNGELTFDTPPDYDSGKSSYTVSFDADDGVDTINGFTVTINIIDLNDQAPSFNSGTSASLYENTTATGYTADATNPDTVGDAISYTLAGTGADDALFEIDSSTGVLSFVSAPDYEANGSNAGNNTYVVDIRAFDGLNPAIQTVTVTVDDALPNPPVITPPSVCDVDLDEGDTFLLKAASAVDDLDDDLTASIVVNNPVDTSVPGDYSVTYNVTNSEGDDAVEVSCVVSVNALPRVFINGAAVINMDEGATYAEAGAKATDLEDGTLTVITSGTIDTSTAGTYDISYTATDGDGASVTAVRRVIVKAEAGVVLGVNSLTIDSGEFALGDGAYDPISTGGITEFTMSQFQGSVPGVYDTTCDSTPDNATPDCTAQDYSPSSLGIFDFANFGPVGIYTADTDGTAQNVGLALPSGTVNTVDGTITLNIPSWIAFWNGNSFAQGPTTPDGTKIEGTGTYNPSTQAYSIEWDALVVGGAFDGQFGHWQIAGTADLVAFDAVYPVITLNGDSQVAIAQGDAYTDAGVASATDNTDGDLGAGNVTVSGGVDTNTLGTYIITYSIADSSGNVAVVTREVVVTGAGSQPVLALNGATSVTVNLGSTYIDTGAVATDAEDDNTALTAAIVTSGSVDTSRKGSYVISYNVTDNDDNAAFQINRTINVIDVTGPVISVTGANPAYVALNAAYNDEGATAADDSDTNPGITNRITTVSTVDTSVEGQYTVIYDVVDTSGNAAATATRTVYVDGTAPAVSITGNASIALNIGDVFTDEGAAATDGVSGSLNIITTCDVDTTTAGLYTCTYVAVDDAGNETTVTRTVTVLDTTIAVSAPVLTLDVTQASEMTSVVVVGNGLVSVSTDIVGDTNTFDWSATDNNLVATDAVTDAANFSFNPAELAAGTYELVVTTNAATDKEVTSRKLIQVIVEAPTFTTDDSDGDGVADSIEGLADDDNDGVPNFLDDSAQQQNEIGVAAGRVMTSSVGTLRMGTIAFAAADLLSGDFSSEIDVADIVGYGGDAGTQAPANTDDDAVEASCVGGCFDFEVSQIDPGASIDIVIPLSAPLSETAAYRKYTTTNGWAAFDTSGNDAIASSGLVNGVCPQPDAANRWIDGLFAGDVCIKLTIQDGGVNDADNVANGTVVDPGGAANLPAEVEPARDFAEGCSTSNRTISPWARADWLVLALFVTLIGMRKKLKSVF